MNDMPPLTPIASDTSPLAWPEAVLAHGTPFAKIAAGPGITYLVKGLLPEGGLIAVAGQPAVGKSAWLATTCLSLGSGLPVAARKSLPATVLYVLLEGEAGFGNRLLAVSDVEGIDLKEARALVYDHFLQILDDSSVGQLVRYAKVLATLGRPVVVVIDTLAQAIGGDGNENDGACMQRVIAACRRLIREACATVILVHHDTKNGAGTLRGHSSLMGAVDVALYLEKSANGSVTLRILKSKESDPSACLDYRIIGHQVGVDEDGEPITAPVATLRGEAALETADCEPTHPNHRAVLTALRSASTDGLDRDGIVQAIVAAGTIGGAKVPRAVDNALQWLVAQAYIALTAGRYRVA